MIILTPFSIYCPSPYSTRYVVLFYVDFSVDEQGIISSRISSSYKFLAHFAWIIYFVLPKIAIEFETVKNVRSILGPSIRNTILHILFDLKGLLDCFSKMDI